MGAAVLALLGAGWLAARAVRSAARPAGRPLARAGLPLADACRAAGVRFPPPSPRLEVGKDDRVLRLYAGRVLVKEYRVALGWSPAGDKEREGDGRTPEGEFYVCTRSGRSRFFRFLGISYPDPSHARKARLEGRISESQYQAILRARRERRQPPWDTPLGGAVGIHGGGTAADWTLGCIALESQEVGELFPVVPAGTPVVIRP